ncbi:PREDICTED: phosphoinositide phosphatase SAC2-like isoform X2 [Lupinus angustifolius]|uniref:phosphoinositide phosphatase SAC2-like isoform X2 n=1 Tax=Lupinus angustifolius TaxID=3871 RepID=UPI00092FAE2A|nr:PREDICTED: phosphoinositide phosphatase SAC2-like isoform X2 [Lupinus angustifolius]
MEGEVAMENQVVNEGVDSKFSSCSLQKFKLYETHSRYYIIGRDKSRSHWKVLKIDRLEPSELSITEDPTIFSEIECIELLNRIREGNKSTGGLKCVTTCYGIIGFVKFLEPYYMMLITKRRKIGTICGHAIYAVTKSEMIPVPHATVQSKVAYSSDENRYKKLLCSVDLTKDFFFSYSYHVMLSLQKNLSDSITTGKSLYETMFVWNEFLTRGIRNTLQNTSWTVALVHGFFEQVKLSISEREFYLTVIARRSRHFAGTRYLKRGVNEKGRVANDVETEQIVFADAHDGCPMQISSVVQIRGSIPLFWSQETSRLNIRPDIMLSKEDHSFEATRLHFENLAKRYGNPIIILNLIKTREKKPRESILRAEFVNAVRSINKNWRGGNRLKFLDWDLNLHSRSKASNVLTQLGKVAAYALKFTGIFYCQVTPRLEGLLGYSNSEKCVDEGTVINNHLLTGDVSGDSGVKPRMLQAGVLRTNCIDCLDRTNVAQFAYGLAALACQLQALGFIESPYIDLDSHLAKETMKIYESMGDTIALQYAGSAAQKKIFSEKRGQWKPATKSQEFIRNLQRYCNNTYFDGNKQKAINLFLGHFQPQQDKPLLWQMDSDQHYLAGKHVPNSEDNTVRPTIKRSMSDGIILSESDTTIRNMGVTICKHSSAEVNNSHPSESAADMLTCESDICHCRQIYSGMVKEKSCETDEVCFDGDGDLCDFSDVFDFDWLTSSPNSHADEVLGRCSSISSENIVNEGRTDTSTCASESGSSMKGRMESIEEFNKNNKYSKSFGKWVEGDMFFL